MISKAHYRSATLADGLTLPLGKGLGRQAVVLAVVVGLAIVLGMIWLTQPAQLSTPVAVPAPAQVPSTPRVAVVTSGWTAPISQRPIQFDTMGSPAVSSLGESSNTVTVDPVEAKLTQRRSVTTAAPARRVDFAPEPQVAVTARPVQPLAPAVESLGTDVMRMVLVQTLAGAATIPESSLTISAPAPVLASPPAVESRRMDVMRMVLAQTLAGAATIPESSLTVPAPVQPAVRLQLVAPSSSLGQILAAQVDTAPATVPNVTVTGYRDILIQDLAGIDAWVASSQPVVGAQINPIVSAEPAVVRQGATARPTVRPVALMPKPAAVSAAVLPALAPMAVPVIAPASVQAPAPQPVQVMAAPVPAPVASIAASVQPAASPSASPAPGVADQAHAASDHDEDHHDEHESEHNSEHNTEHGDD